jgi:hypothetical protein
LESFPEDLVAGLGKIVNSFEVRAGSNLKVVVSLISSAADDLSVDADDGAPVFGKLVLVALSALEIEFSTVSEVLDPFTCTAAVFLDGQEFVGFSVLDSGVVALIEGVKVVVELKAGHADGALDGVGKLGKLGVDGNLTVVDGQIGGSSNLSVSNSLLDLEKKNIVERLGNSDDLGVSLVGS